MGELPNQQPINQDVQPPDGWPDNISAQLGENVIPTPDDINGGVTAETQIAGPTHKEIHAGSAESTEATEQQPENPAGIEPAYPSDTEAVESEPSQPEASELPASSESVSETSESEPAEANPELEHFIDHNSEATDDTDDEDDGSVNPDGSKRLSEDEALATAAGMREDADFQNLSSSLGERMKAIRDRDEKHAAALEAGGALKEFEDDPANNYQNNFDSETANEVETKYGELVDKYNRANKTADAASLNLYYNKTERKAALERDIIDNIASESESSALTLFNINPDAFKDMGAPEFVEKVKQFEGFDRSSQKLELIGKNLVTLDHDLEAIINREEVLPMGNIQMIARTDARDIEWVLGKESEDIRVLMEDLKAVTADLFNKTPRRVFEGFQGWSAKASEALTAAKERNTAAKAEFLKQFEPEDAATKNSEATEPKNQ